MKKTFLTFITSVALSASLWAQAPQAFNYQGVARDLTGTALAAKNISVKASILDGSASGTLVYAETHAIPTNQFGLFSLAIGKGTVASGTFANTNWASGNKYLKIEIDPNGGSSYTLAGTTQLLSVPYAMYAGKAGDSKWSDVTGGINYSGGKVGIGTTTPTALLEISSPDPLTAGLILDASKSSAFSIGFKGKTAQENWAGISYIGLDFTATSDQANTGNLILNGGTNGQIIRTWGNGEIKFSTSNGLVPGEGQPLERMRIDKTGNIGIGTKTPKAKLQITSGDVYLDDATKGIIMKNTVGQCYRVTVGTAGALVSTLITCP